MLKQKLVDDQLAALKSGDKVKLELLRYILAQIQNKEIEKRAELNDDDVAQVLKKQAKELQESIDSFKTGGRQDLVDQNQKQFEILQAYLPQEISDQELETEIKKVVDANQELFAKNSKAILGLTVKELKSKASPDRVVAMLKAKWQI